MNRRGFLAAALAACAAPSVVRSGILMPVRPIWTPPQGILDHAADALRYHGLTLGCVVKLGNDPTLYRITGITEQGFSTLVSAVEKDVVHADGRPRTPLAAVVGDPSFIRSFVQPVVRELNFEVNTEVLNAVPNRL